jgi:putative ABC transport system permease protein
VMIASLGPQKLILNLLGIFAATALLLACIGLYGVMSYSVSNRARELSIRTALGAARRDIFRLIVGHGARLIVLGLVLGLAASIALGRVLVSRLHGLTAGDPLVLGCAASLLVAVALVACWLPARRAAKADPVAALRAE